MKEKYYLQSDIAEITKNLEKHLKYFSGKKFLISGANGFLGKYFIKTLINLNKKLKKKTSIVAIDIKFDKCEIYSDKNVKKIEQDINNINKLNFLLINTEEEVQNIQILKIKLKLTETLMFLEDLLKMIKFGQNMFRGKLSFI